MQRVILALGKISATFLVTKFKKVGFWRFLKCGFSAFINVKKAYQDANFFLF